MNQSFIKKLSILLIAFVFMFLVSCEIETKPVDDSTDVEMPKEFAINEGTLIFEEEEGLRYRIEISDGELTFKRWVNSGQNLNDLNIPEGDYMIKLQAVKGTNESEFTEALSYHQIDLYRVYEIKGTDLIDGKYIKWMGRTSYDEVKEVNTVYYTAGGFSVKVKAAEEELTLTAVITGTNTSTVSKQPYIVLVMDNEFDNAITLTLTKPETEVVLIGEGGFASPTDGEIHEVSVYKRSESIDSHIALKSLVTSGKFIEGVEYKERKIEVIAASSSTGYGNLSNSTKTTANSDGLKAFAFLTAQALDAELSIVSASGWGISASAWTSPQTINMHDKYFMVDCFSNEAWDTSKYTPDVIVTNFGTNDLSYINLGRNDAEKAERRENFIATYVDFLDRLQRTYPDAQIIILYGLMNESGVYADHEEIYARAKQIIPNLEMIKINGDAKGYNSHPSVTSHAAIAQTLTQKIKDLMGW